MLTRNTSIIGKGTNWNTIIERVYLRILTSTRMCVKGTGEICKIILPLSMEQENMSTIYLCTNTNEIKPRNILIDHYLQVQTKVERFINAMLS